MRVSEGRQAGASGTSVERPHRRPPSQGRARRSSRQQVGPAMSVSALLKFPDNCRRACECVSECFSRAQGPTRWTTMTVARANVAEGK
jgi:hypothetical protein